MNPFVSLSRFFLSIRYPLYYRGIKGSRFRTGDLSFNVRRDSYDLLAVKEVAGSKEYTGAVSRLAKGSIVIDIGAHIGAFSLLASRTAGKVYSIEPNKETFGLLKKNIKLNKADNIIASDCAISGKQGTVEFYADGANNAMSSLYSDGQGKGYKVRTLTLPSFMKQNRIKRIDLLKIDAEGAEYDILLGLKDLSPIGSIILEYHDYLDHGHTFREIMEKLSANGFRVKVGGPRLHRLLLRTGYIVAER